VDTRQRILSYAYDIFNKLGVRAVTLDMIAKDLGISKKTVYQHFDKKADIVQEVCQMHIAEEEYWCVKIATEAQDAVDELYRLIKMLIEIFRKVPPQIVYEIRKYYPEAWIIIENHTNGFVLDKVKENLHRGIKEGYYREGIDVDIVSRMRIGSIQMGFDPMYFPLDQYDYGKVQVQLFEVYMYGIMTDKGKILLDQYLEKENYT